MVANLEVGSVVEGKVTGIKPFGAFVALTDDKQGLVHISEVAHGYVKDINDVLSVGDEVKVKILSVDEESGKISLSIRATLPAQEKKERPRRDRRANQITKGTEVKKAQGFNTLEDKLKVWLKQSNEIQADLNRRAKK